MNKDILSIILLQTWTLHNIRVQNFDLVGRHGLKILELVLNLTQQPVAMDHLLRLARHQIEWLLLLWILVVDIFPTIWRKHTSYYFIFLSLFLYGEDSLSLVYFDVLTWGRNHTMGWKPGFLFLYNDLGTGWKSTSSNSWPRSRQRRLMCW